MPKLSQEAAAAIAVVEKEFGLVVSASPAGPGFLSRLYDKVAGYFRASGVGLVGALAMAAVYMVSPGTTETAVWKLALIAGAAYGGYWLDRHIFPYARPDTFVAGEPAVFVGAMYRRAVVLVGTMIAVGLAL